MVRIGVNDRVMAKWPGSNLWFEGKVVDLNDKEFQIQFDDEAKSEYIIRAREVKLYSAFQRSRSRSRGRSKSRTRKTNQREVEVKEEVAPAKEEIAPAKEEVQVVNAKLPTPEPKQDSPKPVPRLPIVDSLEPRTSTPTRQSMRIASLVDKNSVDQVNNVNANKNTAAKPEEVPRPGLGARLCGGVSCIGSSLKSGLLMLIPSLSTVAFVPVILLMLALPLVLNRMCTKKTCTIMAVPDIPTKLEYYYNLNAVGIVAVGLLLILLLGLIPLGRKVDLPNGAVVRCNGYLSVLVALALIPSLMYFNYNVLEAYRLYQHFLATVTVFGVLLGLVLYIRARSIPNDAKNPAGNTGAFLRDFAVGRETIPAIAGVDVKYFIYRAMAIGVLLLNVIVVVKDLDMNKNQYSPTLLMACLLQIFFAMDFIWFEESYSTMVHYTGVGCGWIYIQSLLLGPFYLALNSRVVLNHRTELEWYFLSLIAVLYFFGYTLYRGSYCQMHAFRKNPSDPALAHLESLPTSAGTRLLVSGVWGVVRHPNFLGQILIYVAFALLNGFNLGLPWVVFALASISLGVHIYEIEGDSKRKYGTAWDSYTERVKYRLIPKVY